MSYERYLELEAIRTEDPEHNQAIIDRYPDEWADFNIAYKWYVVRRRNLMNDLAIIIKEHYKKNCL